MPETKNPIFPKWHDPHLFISSDYMAGLGGGDVAKGYDIIEDSAIKAWNKNVDDGTIMPKTSKEHGMDWIPDFGPDSDKINKKRQSDFNKTKGK